MIELYTNWTIVEVINIECDMGELPIISGQKGRVQRLGQFTGYSLSLLSTLFAPQASAFQQTPNTSDAPGGPNNVLVTRDRDARELFQTKSTSLALDFMRMPPLYWAAENYLKKYREIQAQPRSVNGVSEKFSDLFRAKLEFQKTVKEGLVKGFEARNLGFSPASMGGGNEFLKTALGLHPNTAPLGLVVNMFEAGENGLANTPQALEKRRQEAESSPLLKDPTNPQEVANELLEIWDNDLAVRNTLGNELNGLLYSPLDAKSSEKVKEHWNKVVGKDDGFDTLATLFNKATELQKLGASIEEKKKLLSANSTEHKADQQLEIAALEKFRNKLRSELAHDVQGILQEQLPQVLKDISDAQRAMAKREENEKIALENVQAFGELTNAMSHIIGLFDPKAGQIFGQIGNVMAHAATVAAVGATTGPVVGLAVAVVDLVVSLLSGDGNAAAEEEFRTEVLSRLFEIQRSFVDLYRYLDFRFDRLEYLNHQVFEHMQLIGNRIEILEYRVARVEFRIIELEDQVNALQKSLSATHEAIEDDIKELRNDPFYKACFYSKPREFDSQYSALTLPEQQKEARDIVVKLTDGATRMFRQLSRTGKDDAIPVDSAMSLALWGNKHGKGALYRFIDTEIQKRMAQSGILPIGAPVPLDPDMWEQSVKALLAIDKGTHPAFTRLEPPRRKAIADAGREILAYQRWLVSHDVLGTIVENLRGDWRVVQKELKEIIKHPTSNPQGLEHNFANIPSEMKMDLGLAQFGIPEKTDKFRKAFQAKKDPTTGLDLPQDFSDKFRRAQSGPLVTDFEKWKKDLSDKGVQDNVADEKIDFNIPPSIFALNQWTSILRGVEGKEQFILLREWSPYMTTQHSYNTEEKGSLSYSWGHWYSGGSYNGSVFWTLRNIEVCTGVRLVASIGEPTYSKDQVGEDISKLRVLSVDMQTDESFHTREEYPEFFLWSKEVRDKIDTDSDPRVGILKELPAGPLSPDLVDKAKKQNNLADHGIPEMPSQVYGKNTLLANALAKVTPYILEEMHKQLGRDTYARNRGFRFSFNSEFKTAHVSVSIPDPLEETYLGLQQELIDAGLPITQRLEKLGSPTFYTRTVDIKVDYNKLLELLKEAGPVISYHAYDSEPKDLFERLRQALNIGAYKNGRSLIIDVKAGEDDTRKQLEYEHLLARKYEGRQRQLMSLILKNFNDENSKLREALDRYNRTRQLLEYVLLDSGPDVFLTDPLVVSLIFGRDRLPLATDVIAQFNSSNDEADFNKGCRGVAVETESHVGNILEQLGVQIEDSINDLDFALTRCAAEVDEKTDFGSPEIREFINQLDPQK